MYCVNCGNEVPDNATFCPVCGQRMAGADAAGGARPEVVASHAREPESAHASDAQATPRSSNGRVIAVICILAVALGIGGFLFLRRAQSSGSTGTQQSASGQGIAQVDSEQEANHDASEPVYVVTRTTSTDFDTRDDEENGDAQVESRYTNSYNYDDHGNLLSGIGAKTEGANDDPETTFSIAVDNDENGFAVCVLNLLSKDDVVIIDNSFDELGRIRSAAVGASGVANFDVTYEYYADSDSLSAITYSFPESLSDEVWEDLRHNSSFMFWGAKQLLYVDSSIFAAANGHRTVTLRFSEDGVLISDSPPFIASEDGYSDEQEWFSRDERRNLSYVWEYTSTYDEITHQESASYGEHGWETSSAERQWAADGTLIYEYVSERELVPVTSPSRALAIFGRLDNFDYIPENATITYGN